MFCGRSRFFFLQNGWEVDLERWALQFEEQKQTMALARSRSGNSKISRVVQAGAKCNDCLFGQRNISERDSALEAEDVLPTDLDFVCRVRLYNSIYYMMYVTYIIYMYYYYSILYIYILCKYQLYPIMQI